MAGYVCYVNQNKASIRFHLTVIALLILSNVLTFSLITSLQKENRELERELKELYQSDPHADDLWYAFT